MNRKCYGAYVLAAGSLNARLHYVLLLSVVPLYDRIPEDPDDETS